LLSVLVEVLVDSVEDVVSGAFSAGLSVLGFSPDELEFFLA
jgi:hypothetical protein